MSIKKTERLDYIIAQQESLLDSLKAEAKSIKEDNLTEQNEQLLNELNAVNKRLDGLEKENAGLKKQLTTAQGALFAKMANEKLMVFSATQKKIEKIYYQSASDSAGKLEEYKKGCQNSIKQTIEVVEGYGLSQYDEILEKLHKLNAELDEVHSRVMAYQNDEVFNAMAHNNALGAKIKNEPLTENEKRTGLKQKNLESYIGLNVLSKAGILLFLVGIILLGRFAYIHMTDVFKGCMIFALGALLIAIGELFYKKEKTAFSTALISGGVAVLYAAAATSLFAFSLISVNVAFVLCVVITAIAIVLSNQTKSQVVCAFGAVGGYLPVVCAYMIGFGKAASDVSFLPVSSIYFCVLAVIIFFMTYNKKWYAAQYIGYSLHIIAVAGIAQCAWSLRNLAGYGYALPLAVGFAVVSFAIYLLMPASKILTGKPVRPADTVLLGLNTVSGAISVSVTIHNCFEKGIANRAVSVVFLIFAVLYAVLMIKSNVQKSKSSMALTVMSSISALVFSMLVVPYMFGIEYAPLAWAVEGAILAIFSIQKSIKPSELAGLACIVLSACGVLAMIRSYETDVTLNTISFSVVIACAWAYCLFGLVSEKGKSLYIVSELIMSVASFGYLCYIYNCITNGPTVLYYSSITDVAFYIIFAIVIAVIIRLGIFKNTASVMMSDITGLILLPVTLIALNILNDYNDITGFYGESVKNTGIIALNIILLIAINIAVSFFLSKSVGSIINKTSAPTWIYTAVISLSSLALITSVLMAQFDIAFSSVIISGIYILAACILLVIGFKKRYTVVRSGGLVIILCAFAKLCFIDTSQMDSGWKIASYFAFGAILIVISYFYQSFSKKLEREAEKIAEWSDDGND